MAPHDVVQRRADMRAATALGHERAATSRRSARRLRSAKRRRLHRLRRTVLLALALLFAGTVMARGAQDPLVAVPRGGHLDTPVSGSTSRAVPGDDVASRETPPTSPRPASVASASTDPAPVAPSVEPTDPMGEAEEGAPEPTAAPGTSLPPVQASAGGALHALAIPQQKWSATGRAVRLSIEVEDGLDIAEAAFAATVSGILSDSRGWQKADRVRFVPVSPEEVRNGATVDVRVTLATPTLTAKLCGPLRVSAANVSCWWGGRAVLNLHRWIRGSASYGGDITSYRTYLVNHEVGHGLGHRHVLCPGKGQPAPIMVQQTLSLQGCRAWPWPAS